MRTKTALLNQRSGVSSIHDEQEWIDDWAAGNPADELNRRWAMVGWLTDWSIRLPDNSRELIFYQLCFLTRRLWSRRRSRRALLQVYHRSGLVKLTQSFCPLLSSPEYYRGTVKKVRNLALIFDISRLWGTLLSKWSSISEIESVDIIVLYFDSDISLILPWFLRWESKCEIWPQLSTQVALASKRSNVRKI